MKTTDKSAELRILTDGEIEQVSGGFGNWFTLYNFILHALLVP
jgi:hypothetical protein